MTQLNTHRNSLGSYPPPTSKLSTSDLPLLKHLGDGYKIWHVTLQNIPKLSRFTLGAKIDTLFIETVEFILLAGYAPKNQKLSIIKRASTKLDALKFFLQLAWETKSLDNKKYLVIAKLLEEAGKMLGGWQRQIEKEHITP
jgi:hypothetical protein